MKHFTNMTAILLLLTMILTLCTGCGDTRTATPPTSEEAFCKITDATGREVVLTKKPERIAVTSASFLEPLHEVGGTVVGRPDSKTIMPDYAKDAAGIGQVYEIDTEKLLACRPDLVIINKGMNEKLLGLLEESNISAIVLGTKTYADVKDELLTFARITGNDAKGQQIIDDMDAQINATAAKIPADKKRVAILHGTAQGLSVQLPGSIAGNVVAMLGFENVAQGMTAMEKNPDAAPYSLETLAAQNPEIIFVTSMGKIEDIKANMEQMVAENPAWQAIPAVKNGKMFYLPQDLFLLSPGIHYPEAVTTVAQLVYPEIFP